MFKENIELLLNEASSIKKMYWYENDVKNLEKEVAALPYNPTTLFYGSSSVRLWHSLYKKFEAFKPVNLGFGGSTLAACDWFFERIVAPFNAKCLVIYAGDNDLGDGRNPEEVLIFFQQLVVKIALRYPAIPCYFISIKPSIARWDISNKIKYTNELVENEIHLHNNWKFINIYDLMLGEDGFPNKEYYEQDGLHLSEKGYAVWNEVMYQELSKFNTELI